MPVAPCLSGMILLLAAAAAEIPLTDSGSEAVAHPATRQPDGLYVHRVESSLQAGPTRLKVLLPDRLDLQRKHRVLYLLPVEAGDGTFWGDAMAEVRKANLQNRFGLICVYPTFADLPWYADHPTNPRIRQEAYLLSVVLPAIESRYPGRDDRQGRLLVGFSKSGWGAFSLLLRHPDRFGRAAAWDAPLAEQQPARFGMGPIFGTQENFEKYQITRLLARQAEPLRPGAPRLILLGYDNFRPATVATHDEMQRRGIPHVYRDGPQRKHHWQSGWLAEAVELLAGEEIEN